MKKTLRIGGIALDGPFLLAPLAGITDKTMRSLCSSAGASLTYTEMVSGKGLWYGDRKTRTLLEIGDGEGPVGYQLFGRDPEVLSASVSLLSGVPASEIALPERGRAGGLKTERMGNVLFDLNCGCPVPKIVKNGEGSALLKEPDLIYDLISAMVKASQQAAGAENAKPVTAKIRRGFYRDDDVAVEVAKAVEAAGAAAITVHGRTREQFYEGHADWSAIARVKDAVSIPVIGNGDVMCGADAIRMMEETGCDGVMIARGALGNPWIFAEAKALLEGDEYVPPTLDERIEMFCRHLDMVCADRAAQTGDIARGESMAVKEMRKHVGWYTRGMHGAAAVRRASNDIEKAETLKELIRSLA